MSSESMVLVRRLSSSSSNRGGDPLAVVVGGGVSSSSSPSYCTLLDTNNVAPPTGANTMHTMATDPSRMSSSWFSGPSPSLHDGIDIKSPPPVPHTASYYAHCAAGGVTASCIRWATTPLEVVKGYVQIGHYPNQQQGVVAGLRRLFLQEGVAGMYRGLGPTAFAYACQTGTKYSLYEFFRDRITVLVDSSGGDDDKRTAALQQRHRGMIYGTAAASAEACACVLMCPMEMVRVRVQTCRPASEGGTFPTTTRAAIAEMVRHHHKYRFPFGALGPLWARQIPGTVANFYVFESVARCVYERVLTSKPKHNYSASAQLTVTLAAGYVSGFVCALVSHPADSLITLMSVPANRHKPLRQIAAEVGFRSLLTKGLAPRVVMTGTIIGFQWWIYDGFKTAMGMGTTGGGGGGGNNNFYSNNNNRHVPDVSSSPSFVPKQPELVID